MGNNQKSEPEVIQITLNTKFDMNTLFGGKDLGAPQPVFEASAVGKSGKKYPVKIISQIENNNEIYSDTNNNSITKPTETDDKTINEKNVNSININNSFSLFNTDNINNNNINDNNNENINDKNKEDKNIINKNNNKNSFLKEGVKSGTIIGDEEEDKQEKENKHQTPGGINNIDMNIAQNKQEENSEIKIAGKTPMEPEGNVDINQGSNYDKNKDKDNYVGLQYSINDLELSQSVYIAKENILNQYKTMIEKGYHPVFLTLKDNPAYFFFIREESTLKSLVRMYYRNCSKTDEGFEKDTKLYYEDRRLDINTKIKYLNLPLFCGIKDVKIKKKKISD